MKRKYKMLSAAVCIFAIMMQSITMCFAAGISAIDTKYVTAANEISYDTYMAIPYGAAPEKIVCGYSTNEKEEHLGPKSFSIGENGEVYILDTVNECIKVYDTTDGYKKTINLPQNVYALDMEVCDGEVYIMCDNGVIYKKNIEDNIVSIAWEQIATYSIISIAGLYRENGNVYGRAWDGNDMLLSDTASIETAAKAVPVTMSYSEADKKVSIVKAETAFCLNFAAEPIGAYIIKQIEGDTYILEREALLGYAPYAEMRVAKYNNGNKVATALLIPTTEYEYSLPFKKLYVSDNGTVYQMIPEKDGITIYIVPWKVGEKTRITQQMIELDKVQVLNESLYRTDTPTYASRETALDRAHAMVYYGWQYNAATHFTQTSETTKSPQHLPSTGTAIVNGIPYCWGGMNGIDTGTYTGSTYTNMQNFATALANGKTAGNIETPETGFVSTTAGIDCTGFISVAYMFTHKLGSNIPDYFTQTTWADAIPGDVADGPRHAFMLKYKYNGGTGNYMMSTYESTIDGSEDGAVIYYRDYVDVVNEYNIYGID